MDYLDPITRAIANNISYSFKNRGCFYWIFIGWFLTILKVSILIIWFLPIGLFITTIKAIYNLIFQKNTPIDTISDSDYIEDNISMNQKNIRGPELTNALSTYTFKVTGTSFEKRDIILKRFGKEIIDSLKDENKYKGLNTHENQEKLYFSEYRKCYEFSLNDSYIKHYVNLIHEANNQYDPNAIRVFIDSEMIGYVESKSTQMVKNILTKNPKIFAQLTGGNYKYLDYDKETIEIATDDYGVLITLEYRN